MTQQIKIISLKNQKEFNIVSKVGKKIHGKHFICVLSNIMSSRNGHSSYPGPSNKPNGWIPHQVRDDIHQIYLGLKVSRKMGNAVTRNKIKRWFRNIIRQFVKDNPKYIGYNFILIPKKSITSITYQELLEDFTLGILSKTFHQ